MSLTNHTEGVLAAIGFKVLPAVAGFSGGVVSLMFAQGLTKRQAASYVVVGLLTANYATDPVLSYFHISPDLSGGFGFAIGLFAMGLIPVVQKFVPSIATAVLNHWRSGTSSDPTQGKGGDSK